MEPKGKGEAWSTGAERGRVGGRRKFISRTGMQTDPSKAVGPESRRGGEGTSSRGGEVTRQRVERGEAETWGASLRGKEKTTSWALGPSHPAAMTDVPCHWNSRTIHTWACFQINSLPPEIPEANRPENMGSLSDPNLLPNLGA